MIKCRLELILAQRKFDGRPLNNIADLAEASGVHRDTIYRWINGITYRFDGHVLNALCRTLEMEVGDILVYVPDEQEES